MPLFSLIIKRRLKSVATLLLTLSISISALANERVPLRIAVAANFAPFLKKLLPEFTAQTNIETQVISAASGTLFQQIKHGAPFDIFLSADAQRPQRLSDSQLIIESSRQTYAYGQIALWSATEQFSSFRSFLAYIPTTQRFAIANPDTAPYGKAAKEALIALGLWKTLQNKLIRGTNINQTFQQVRSKAVNAGIVSTSQLKQNKLTGHLIPQQYYQAIEQQLVILKRSKQIENAQQLSQFLLSDTIQNKIAEYGYSPITQARKINLTKSH